MNIVEAGLDRLDYYCLDQILRWRLNGACVAAADVACGQGRFAVLMNRAGAHVLGMDLADHAVLIERERELANTGRKLPPTVIFRDGWSRLQYLKADLHDFAAVAKGPQYDIIYAHGAINYLPADEALGIIRQFRQRMRVSGLLFISASGLSSTPANGWAAAGAAASAARREGSDDTGVAPVVEEFVGPYSEEDLHGALAAAGLEVLLIYMLKSGVVQAIARKP